MPSIRQHNAWKRLAEAGKVYRYKRESRTVHERLEAIEKCFMGFVILVSLLAGVCVYLLLKDKGYK